MWGKKSLETQPNYQQTNRPKNSQGPSSGIVTDWDLELRTALHLEGEFWHLDKVRFGGPVFSKKTQEAANNQQPTTTTTTNNNNNNNNNQQQQQDETTLSLKTIVKQRKTQNQKTEFVEKETCIPPFLVLDSMIYNCFFEMHIFFVIVMQLNTMNKKRMVVVVNCSTPKNMSNIDVSWGWSVSITWPNRCS